jgi:hypothetical protein
MKGLLPDGEKKKFHHEYGLFQGIADLNLVVRPQLTIVDGIFCREGLGYPWSEEIEMDLILVGRDQVGVDKVIMMVMGFDPKLLKHAVLAEEHGIGTMDMNKIQVVGEEIEKVKKKFKTPAETLQEMINLQDFKLISDEKTCTGCRGMMFYFLKALDEQGKIEQIKDWTFVLGEHDRLPDLDKDRTALIGVCNERYEGVGRYVPGFPPLSSALMTTIFEKETKPAYLSND